MPCSCHAHVMLILHELHSLLVCETKSQRQICTDSTFASSALFLKPGYRGMINGLPLRQGTAGGSYIKKVNRESASQPRPPLQHTNTLPITSADVTDASSGGEH